LAKAFEFAQCANPGLSVVYGAATEEQDLWPPSQIKHGIKWFDIKMKLNLPGSVESMAMAKSAGINLNSFILHGYSMAGAKIKL
jgi:hypothetical protein